MDAQHKLFIAILGTMKKLHTTGNVALIDEAMRNTGIKCSWYYDASTSTMVHHNCVRGFHDSIHEAPYADPCNTVCSVCNSKHEG